VKERIRIVKTRSRTDEEHVLCQIDIRLRFVQPNVIKSVRFSRSGREFFPEPPGRLGIRGVDIRPDDVFEASRVRLSVGRVHQPASASLEEWIRNLEVPEPLAVLEILGNQEIALRLDCSGDDQ